MTGQIILFLKLENIDVQKGKECGGDLGLYKDIMNKV